MVFEDCNSQPLFHRGDRVQYADTEGTVLEIFPDGIHVVRLDRAGKVIATIASLLQHAETPAGDHPLRRTG